MRFNRLRWPVVALALAQIAASPRPESVRLVGVGTTSPLVVYAKWFQEFEKLRPDLQFTYIPSGSEAGIDMVTSGDSDFGATDAPITNRTPTKVKVFQVATLVVAIVPIYHLSGVSQPLRFTSHALAGIYLGTITKWNDPAIAGPNGDLQLPAQEIVVIHSSSGRGSTYIWSDYLSKVSAEWRTRVGRGISVEWPTGKSADGNGNVAKMVKETPNSIGYVELGYAMRNRLPSGQVQNAAGHFVSADIASVREAATGATVAGLSDVRSSITNPPGLRAYPIASFTWILISESMASATKQEAMKNFLRWALNEGQNYVEPAGFARLPNTVIQQELKTVKEAP